jgi:2-dehydro-3-deoxygalactonokinase
MDRLLSCDWGTSTFRLRLVAPRPAPRVLRERCSPRGVTAFQAGEAAGFAHHLGEEIDRLLGDAGLAPAAWPIFLSGMVTSTLGWRELPYARLPFAADGSGAVLAGGSLERPYGTHPLTFVSGLRSDDDVLRGEETELVGLLADPSLRGFGADSIVVLPGTHSKVLEVAAGRVVGFRTYMTGELYQVVGQASILRHSVAPDLTLDAAGTRLFEAGVRRAAAEGLSASLFTVRTNVLLGRAERGPNTAYLSGVLIGAEAVSIAGRFAPPRPILVGGTTGLQALYGQALALVGAAGRLHFVPPEISSIAATLGHCALAAVPAGAGDAAELRETDPRRAGGR